MMHTYVEHVSIYTLFEDMDILSEIIDHTFDLFMGIGNTVPSRKATMDSMSHQQLKVVLSTKKLKGRLK